MKANTLLLLAAIIWGFAFVAQRAGMEHVGPFAFNAVRFALGGLVLLPLVLVNRPTRMKTVLLGGGLAGGVLFLAASLQQAGVIYTTAGKAGFITGLYVIMVPILGLLWRQRVGRGVWLGAILAVVGLYLLGDIGNLDVALGDWLVLGSAFFWAVHVHAIGWLASRIDAIPLACCQFLTCSALSLAAMLLVEEPTIQGLCDAALPILYAGFLSTGVAYTLQVVAQRDVHPAHAAIILSLEAVFAVAGGWLILGETLSWWGLLGCALMLAGMMLSQSFVRQ